MFHVKHKNPTCSEINVKHYKCKYVKHNKSFFKLINKKYLVSQCQIKNTTISKVTKKITKNTTN